MKKILILSGIAIIVGFYIIHLYSNSNQQKNNIEQDVEVILRPEVKKKDIPNKNLPKGSEVKKKVIKLDKSKIEDQKAKQIATQGLVEYEVKDGIATVFGDVMLGKPDSVYHKKRGYFEVSNIRLWENAIVPYFIKKGLKNKTDIEYIIGYFNAETSIRFVKLKGEKDAVVFVSGKNNCYSYLGRVGGHQPITLSPKCGKNEIAHEIMHALGFIHEQSRFDRTQYVKINWQNIKDEFKSQYAIAPERWTLFLNDFLFDYKSIMLYRDEAFAKGKGLKTMNSIGSEEISPSKGKLSKMDLLKLNELYGD